MFEADLLTAYLICGASALLGGLSLRLIQPGDADARGARRDCERGFWALAAGLLPISLISWTGHLMIQWTLALGTTFGLLWIASGMGSLNGRRLRLRTILTLAAAMTAVLTPALIRDRLLFGQLFAGTLLAHGMLMAWQTRGYMHRSRPPSERLIGVSGMAMMVSGAVRLAATLHYTGPARDDLMYVPSGWNLLYATFYGVMPMLLVCLLLALLNTRLQHHLQTRAATDELTGALTRRALRERAVDLLKAASRQHSGCIAALMLDLDRFKAINDRHGHAMGDAVLRTASAALQRHLRERDTLLSRYGGEEFVVIVPVDDLAGARRMAERLREAVESVTWQASLQLESPVTVSVGVALVAADEDLDLALQRADEALYRAKRDGRNQCQVALSAA